MVDTRVLLIEDNPVDVALVRAYLAAEAPEAELEHAPSLKVGLARLAARDIEAVLLDLHLPDASGLPLLVAVKERYPTVPVVILTSLEDEGTALRAMRNGAQDYLVKGRMDGRGIVRAVRFAIERMHAVRSSHAELSSAASELRTHLDLVKAEHAALERLLAHAPGAAPPAARAAEVGASLQDRYVLRTLLGKGSYGEAYLALDRTLEREVVVKVLREAFLPESDAERQFVKEARLLASLEHPHVIRLYDFGFHGARPFYVMEHATHGSLAGRIGAEPLSLKETLRLVDEVLQGLEYVHAHGVLHRDLKPANILIGARHEAKIGDFGMALHEARPDATAGGAEGLVGTPAYSAPEALRAAGPLSPASDIYGVGAILFELLVHEPYAKLAEEGPALPRRRLAAAVPPGAEGARLAAIARAALERRPEKRPQSAAQMRAALRGIAP